MEQPEPVMRLLTVLRAPLNATSPIFPNVLAQQGMLRTLLDSLFSLKHRKTTRDLLLFSVPKSGCGRVR